VEQEPAPFTVISLDEEPDPVELAGAPERFTTWHPSENRRQRRAGVATFVGPKEFGKGLRRELVKQRQRNKRGTMKGKQR
jgi:hypothetical protein